MQKALIVCIAILSLLNLNAQYEFHWYDGYDVLMDEEVLPNAWAGGINSAQISRIDMNCDGVLDIFIFDRNPIAGRLLTFISEDGSSGAMDYKYKRHYIDQFPELKNWALLRDYDCDGQYDIFTNKQNGIKIFKNVSNDGPLTFDLELETVLASYNLSGTPFDAVLYCLSVDIPSIVDYEGDGDLDIFTFTEASSTMYFYKNMSQEMYGTCDSLTYKTANRCYAKFNEASESATIIFGDDFECDFNVIDPELVDDSRHGNMHAGGSILSIDLDQNGIKDLVISDVTETYMSSLMLEEHTDGLDSTVSYFGDFPAQNLNAEEVELRTFPAGYYEDINNDGINDLVVSPNTTIDTDDDYSMWLYLNNGSNDLPDFELIKKNFLQEGMLDFGRGAYPVPVDYNGDGLMDLVVSNKEYNEAVDYQPSQLALFENTGSLTIPQFTLLDTNWLDIPQFDLESVHPAFGDMDNDGDLDMILGEEGGLLHYFRNNADDGEPMDLSLNIPSIEDIEGDDLDVGQIAKPILHDMNGDGLLDLLVGERNGNVNYIENVGTAEEFAFVHMIDTIGNVVASNQLGINGYAVPFLWTDNDGNMNMIYGNETGSLNHFTDIEGNLDGQFTEVDEMFGGIWEGPHSGACVYDFDSDGLLDVIHGQWGGGLAFYKGGYAPPPIDDCIVGVDDDTPELEFSVYPNPVSGVVRLQLNLFGSDVKSITVFDQLGRVVTSIPRTRLNEVEIDMSRYSPGVYIVEVESRGRSGKQQLVKL